MYLRNRINNINLGNYVQNLKIKWNNTLVILIPYIHESDIISCPVSCLRYPYY